MNAVVRCPHIVIFSGKPQTCTLEYVIQRKRITAILKKSVFIVLFICGLIAAILFVGAVVQKLGTNETTSSSSPSATTSGTTNSTASTPKSSTTAYTVDQISKHNNKNDCWLIIDGNVYDISGYLTQHPGGVAQVTPYCGKDASQAYATMNGRGAHSSTADEIRQNYQVGTVSN